MIRAPRALFPYARIAVPLAAALTRAHASAAPWLLTLAAAFACAGSFPLRRIVAVAKRDEPIAAPLVTAAVGLGGGAAALAALGFHLSRAASDVAVPVVLVGVLAVLSSLVDLEAPSAIEVLGIAGRTGAERAILDGHRMVPQDERDRLARAIDARAEGAIAGATALLVVEVSVSLFAAAAFLAVALGGGAPEDWAWQGAGAFALALASSTAALARVSTREEGEPLSAFGAALILPFVICAVAAAQGWVIVLAGAPMVFLAILLVAARPARFPRAVDIALTAATAATAIAVAVQYRPSP